MEDLIKEFSGRLIGNKYMKQMVARAVLLLPEQYHEQIVHHTWFFSSDEDSWGYAFDGNDLKNKHLVFLSDVLFDEDESQIIFTILHEIAHILLLHKNSIGFVQTKQEIAEQEKQADDFAKKYLIKED